MNAVQGSFPNAGPGERPQLRRLREHHRPRQVDQAASAAEDEYVAREVEITRARYAADPNLSERLARYESYARWRWQGVANGSIAAL